VGEERGSHTYGPGYAINRSGTSVFIGRTMIGVIGNRPVLTGVGVTVSLLRFLIFVSHDATHCHFASHCTSVGFTF
jgi:hypothetical protein